MTLGDRLERVLKQYARRAGERVGELEAAYRAGQSGVGDELPTDEEGRVQIVCRRYAERRAVALDDLGRPACFEAEHPDCEGCAEDVRTGDVETW